MIRLDCLDCQCERSTYYMVKDSLWNAAVHADPKIPRRSILCLRCLEKRLGRDVCVEDFKADVLINRYLLIEEDIAVAKQAERGIKPSRLHSFCFGLLMDDFGIRWDVGVSPKSVTDFLQARGYELVHLRVTDMYIAVPKKEPGS